MTEYRFDKQEGGKTGFSAGADGQSSGRHIPVEDGQVSFHIGDKDMGARPRLSAIGGLEQLKNVHSSAKKIGFTQSGKSSGKNTAKNTGKTISRNHLGKLSLRVWHALEFIAVSAVIFLVLFFVINFDSYSRLFLSKLDQLRGTVNNNPYVAQQIEKIRNASPEGQQPLPIVNSTQAAKKQVPDLSMEITPPDDRILIPRIGQNVPIIRVPTDKLIQRDWAALENQIQEALRYGVVHFPGTAMAGDDGNVVITGHSSYFPWDPGRFKDVFALLHQVGVGDKVIVYHEQKAYEYEVYEKKIVMPDQVDVLTQKGENRLTLITCTPVGTNLKRLILLAKPV